MHISFGRAYSRLFRPHLFLALLTCFLWLQGHLAQAQTPGLIFKPATGAGAAILDPNGDGYTSTSTTGFTTNDKTQSEIPFVPLAFPMAEPTGDLGPGPDCSFTDFVDSGDEDPALTYFNGTNLFYRLRIGKAFPNSKGYSVLIDTDEKFGLTGPNADPNATTTNPGFEIEISLQTNFGVFVYNVDGICPGGPSSSFAGETNYQKSVALTTNCGDADYFYDFYVPFSALTALGITTSTPLRMAVVTQMNPAAGLCNSALSDFGGIDDNTCGSNPYTCWNTIIDNYPPTCATCTNSGDRSACPAITSPIAANATSVSGTSTEASGTTIRVYKNGVLVGTTTTSGSAWTLSGLTALVSGDVITATAQATGESVSIANCNSVTVAQTCTAIPTALAIVSGTKGIQGSITNPTSATITITIYNFPANTVWSGATNPVTTTTTTWSVACSTGNCLPNGAYYAKAQAIALGECQSAASAIICSGISSSAATTITTTTISTTTTSISGTSGSGASVTLYINGVASGFTTTASGTTWTINSISGLIAGQSITAVSYTSGTCPTTSAAKTVEYITSAPTLSGTYCTSSTITSVSGTSTEAAGTVIQVYKGAAGSEVAHGSTTTVSSNGTWTASTGISFTAGQIISARATASGGTQSGFSNYVTVGTITTNAIAITSSPITEGNSSVSGTGTNSDVIRLYIDGVQIGGTTTVASGVWTISGLGSLDLYAGGTVTATATSPGNCAGAPSAGVVVACSPPTTSLSVSPDNATICSGTTVSNIQISSSTSGIIYQVYNGGSPSGSSVLGTGGTITLTSGALSAATTLTIKAIKIGGVTCESFLTENIGVSINPNPTTSLTVTTDAASVCTGTGTNVNVQLSQSGFSYQLRNNSNNALIGSAVAGTGGTIVLPTGNLSSNTAFNILVTGVAPSNCSATLITTPTVSVSANPTTSNAGTNQDYCSLIGITLAANTPTVGTGAWSVSSGPSTSIVQFSSTSNPAATFTAAGGAGSYVLVWTISNSPCTSSPSTVTLTFTDLPAIPTVASTTQPTCGTPTGTIVFNTQAGVEYGVNGTYQASPTFSGLSSGVKTLSVRSTTNNSCSTNAASTVTINAAPTPPTTPTVSSTTQPTCAVPTGTIVFNTQAGVEYSVGSGYQASATFSGLAAGTYTLSVRSTTDNTCTRLRL